jgi:polygalacturonase
VKKAFSIIVCLFSMANLYSQKVFNIKTYGARPDNGVYATSALQKAINAAHKNGGGIVVVPPGVFLTAPIVLKSGVELYLSKDAILLGSARRLDYGVDSAVALITANRQTNISITGKGTVDGQGQEVVKDMFVQLQAGKLKDDHWKIHRPDEKNRPKIIEFKNCSNIKIKGITIKNSACWVQEYTNCDRLLMDSVKVISTAYWNNDGIDVNNSSNVKITNCFVDAADDAICLKSEISSGICENIYVANCVLRSSASAFKMGTASHGGFKNIKVNGLKVYDTFRSAISLEAVDGGIMEDIDVSDVVAKNTGCALFIKLGHRNKNERYSSVKNIRISNLFAEIPSGKPDMGYPVEGPLLTFQHNVFPASISGIPGHLVQDVTLENVNIVYEGGAKKERGYISLDSLDNVAENASAYPEFSMFGELPAWGIYVRHVEGLQIKNVRISTKAADFRPAMVFNDVTGLKINELAIPAPASPPQIVFKNVNHPITENMKLPGNNDTAILLK